MPTASAFLPISRQIVSAVGLASFAGFFSAPSLSEASDGAMPSKEGGLGGNAIAGRASALPSASSAPATGVAGKAAIMSAVSSPPACRVARVVIFALGLEPLDPVAL